MSRRIHWVPVGTNESCSSFGLVNSGLDSFQHFSRLEQKEENLLLGCQRVQERPPFEGYNELVHPFLPVMLSKDTIDKRQSMVESQSYSLWAKRLNSVAGKLLNKMTLTPIISTFGMVGPLKANSKNLHYLEKMDALWQQSDPSHLYSSSCILKTNSYVAHGSLDGNLYLGKQLDDNTLLLTDKQLKSKIYGVKSDGKSLFAVKYRQGVAVMDACLDNGTVLSRVNKCCADVTVLKYLDSFVTVDTKGTVTHVNYVINRAMDPWQVFGEEMQGYNWCYLDNCPASPFSIRVCTRGSVDLFDVRQGTRKLKLYEVDGSRQEVIGGMCCGARVPENLYQFYLSTNKRTLLMDERFSSKSMCEWHHATASHHYVSAGIANHYDSDTGLEYVVSYWSNGDVSLLANDWKHSLCPERLVSSDSSLPLKLSCQSTSDRHEQLYPLSRGLPVNISSINSILNRTCLSSDRSTARLTVPWTGLTLFAGSPDKSLNLVSINEVGDLFHSKLVHNEVIKQHQLWAHQKLSINEFLDEESIQEDNPLDYYQMFNWLQRQKGDEKKDLDHLKLWESKLNWNSKVSFAMHLHWRYKLPPSASKNKRTVKRACAKKEIKKTNKGGRPPRPKPNINVFKSVPHLAEIKDFEDEEGQRVDRIFQGLSLFSDTSSATEGSESDTTTHSSFSVTDAVARKDRTRNLPEDTQYTMGQFLQGLQDNNTMMTSTQEDEEEDNRSESRSKGSSGKKSKKKYQAGF